MYRIVVVAAAAFWVLACSDSSTPKGDASAEQVPAAHWSAARHWNEALLAAIRRDLARPTVHARNLFHSSALMYDLWAVYDDTATPYFLGDEDKGAACALSQQDRNSLREGSGDIDGDRSRAISFAMHRLLGHRFENSVGASFALEHFDQTFADLGYERDFQSTDFRQGDARQRSAALGLYAADCVIAHGLSDGANEQNDYANAVYAPVNEALEPELPGAPGIVDPDRWQPLRLQVAIDQAGNPVANQPPFVGAEWGQVRPFALPAELVDNYFRDDSAWPVHHDPGPPALLRGADAQPEEYQWNHSVVLYWSGHLDPGDGVMWDISPASIGNTSALPQTVPALRDFYDALAGGVDDRGHDLNPRTGLPYAPNPVPRGDYTRVLAEFWADGPASETPPGHWFTIANQAVSDHPAFRRRYRGQGPELSHLEWDVKLYFALGSGMHDAAVTAWSIKGWYDYIRPVSAIRYMAAQGQSSDESQDNYHPEGLPLVPGQVEVVAAGDPLAGPDDENLGKIKVRAWRGPDHVDDPAADIAGVGWILAENWWPYQRPTFVSPPFAGYVSGHSTFSRTAAEILTWITGDPYFPGGLGEFVARKDDFLVFERGPSVDVVLQWATYRDASDQTSLSRIWGGIHPPVDDIPGRRLGILIARDVVESVAAHVSGAAR